MCLLTTCEQTQPYIFLQYYRRIPGNHSFPSLWTFSCICAWSLGPKAWVFYPLFVWKFWNGFLLSCCLVVSSLELRDGDARSHLTVDTSQKFLRSCLLSTDDLLRGTPPYSGEEIAMEVLFFRKLSLTFTWPLHFRPPFQDLHLFKISTPKQLMPLQTDTSNTVDSGYFSCPVLVTV